MACYASKVIELAKTQLGYTEKGTNITKYAEDFDTKYSGFYNYKKQGVAWCDMFFDWLLVTSFGMNEALRLTCQPMKSAGAGCRYSFGYYKAKGKAGKEPRIGAQIFFSNTGKEEDINHTGLVISIEGGKVVTIEGNKSDKVSQCSYDKNNYKIYGYGYPDYDEEVQNKPSMPSNKSVEAVAYEVIAGQWGNGAERKTRLENAGYNYSEVQTKVNEILKPAKPKPHESNKYTVTASALNIRPEPNTNKSPIGILYNGHIINVSKVEDGWAKLADREGYVSAKYIKKN